MYYAYPDLVSVMGLGDAESEALSQLHPALVRLIRNEIDDPESREGIRELLRAADPEKAIVGAMVEEVADYARAAAGRELLDPGMAGIGKRFKKLVKKIGKPVVKVVKKYGAVAVAVAGAALAPLTGGISAAASGLLLTGKQLYDKKKAIRMAKAQEKQVSRELEATVEAQRAELNGQADAFFNQNADLFARAGISASTWSGMSVDAKLGAIDKLAKGELPTVETRAAVSEGVRSGELPPPTGVVSAEPAIVPTGRYDLVVDGRRVASAPSLAGISALVGEYTRAGDRFEVVLDGKSTGLKVRTEGGAISIPDDVAGKVRAMDPSEVKELVSKAGAGKGGGFPWILLLAVPAVIAVAS